MQRTAQSRLGRKRLPQAPYSACICCKQEGDWLDPPTPCGRIRSGLDVLLLEIHDARISTHHNKRMAGILVHTFRSSGIHSS